MRLWDLPPCLAPSCVRVQRSMPSNRMCVCVRVCVCVQLVLPLQLMCVPSGAVQMMGAKLADPSPAPYPPPPHTHTHFCSLTMLQ